MGYDVNDAGFLNNPEDWSTAFANWAARQDGLILLDVHWKYINAAKEYYAEYNVVPPIRQFAKLHGMDRKAKELYELFVSSPMKRIARYGGMPAPTGCH